MNRKRNLLFFRNYFIEFIEAQSKPVVEKIDYLLFLITVSERIPKKFFSHLTGTNGLFEIRIEFESNIYRIFCCFDEGNLVVLFNGFNKKTQKIPKNELEKALLIKSEYFNFKESKNESGR